MDRDGRRVCKTSLGSAGSGPMDFAWASSDKTKLVVARGNWVYFLSSGPPAGSAMDF